MWTTTSYTMYVKKNMTSCHPDFRQNSRISPQQLLMFIRTVTFQPLKAILLPTPAYGCPME